MKQFGASGFLRISIWAVWWVLSCGQVCAMELSKEVFPSEDELLEALNEGAIDYDLYRALREIAQHGIDSGNVYLLDLVPNLSYFRRTAGSLQNENEEIQKRPFVRDPGTARPTGTIQYRYQERLGDEEGSLYRLRGRYRFGKALFLSFGVNRELSGRERFVGRRLEYRPSHNALRRVVWGTYSCRFGLGTVLG